MRESDPALWWGETDRDSKYFKTGYNLPCWLLRIKDPEGRLVNSAPENVPGERFAWDSVEGSSRGIEPRHKVAVWDGTRIVGVSLVESITSFHVNTMVIVCPKCSGVGSVRISGSGRYCWPCREEIDAPPVMSDSTTRFEIDYAKYWTPVPDCLEEDALLRIHFRIFVQENPVDEIGWNELTLQLYRRAGILGWVQGRLR